MGRKSFLFQLAAALIVTGLMLSGSVANAVTDDAAQTTKAAQYDETGGGCGKPDPACGGGLSESQMKQIREDKIKELRSNLASWQKELEELNKGASGSGHPLTIEEVTKMIEGIKAELTQLQQGQTETCSGRSSGSSGSCPYLYVWNGTTYSRDNDIIPFKHPSLEGTDYYRIQQPLKPESAYYPLKIAEELPEVSYLDFFRLMIVDHPADVDVYPDINGNLFNISNPKTPVSCIDSYGNDCLAMLKERENGYTPGNYFDGKKGDYFIADFGDLSGAKTIKLVMTTDSCGGRSILVDTAVQSQNSAHEWETHIVFSTHEFWATNVFDITNLLPDANGEYKLRFYFTDSHKIDFVGIDTSQEIEKEVHVVAPVYAGAGKDVLPQVADADGSYAVMTKGDELLLKFPCPPMSDKSGFKRDFVFVSRGYYIRDGQ